MKKWNIVFGVLSILLGAFLFYESSQVHHSGRIVQQTMGIEINAFSLYVGFIVSFVYLGTGICAVLKINENNKKTNFILLVSAIVAFILSFMGPRIFEDLSFCSIWAIICIVTAVLFLSKKTVTQSNGDKKVSKDTLLLGNKRCPYCHAQLADDSKFCGECGKEYPQGNVCAYCGVTVNEEDVYCEECGRNLKDGSYASSDYGKKLNFDYKKILISSLIGIVIGLIVLTIVGGSWYGCNEYSAYRAKKEAREKFVADSLEKVRQDSIKLAAKLEAERIEKEKIERFRENFTFNNILNLLKHPDDASLAQKCGLSLLYKNSETIVDNFMEEGDSYKAYDIAYGYETEKGSKNSEGLGYGIKASSTHSCYFNYLAGRGKTTLFHFKDESDADYLFEMAKDHGLIECCNRYFIPRKKVAKGITHVEEYDPESEALYGITQLGEMNGWYSLEIGMIGSE